MQDPILVVDEHEVVYHGLSAALPDFQFVYAPTIEAARSLTARQPFSSCIVELLLENSTGLDFALWLTEQKYQVMIFTRLLSGYHIRESLSMGARGYFLKQESLGLLEEALKNPHQRNFWMSAIVEKHLRIHEDAHPLKGLTSREMQVFRLLAQGYTYREVANLLYISPKTVNVHKRNVYQKLNITSSSSLFHAALRFGVFSEHPNTKEAP